MKTVNFDNYFRTIKHTYELLERTQVNLNGLKHFARQCELNEWHDIGDAESECENIKALLTELDSILKPF